jgi:hypothetical protein
MPAMPRANIKATKIAYQIIGKPANLNFKRPPQLEKVYKQLVYQNTLRVR